MTVSCYVDYRIQPQREAQARERVHALLSHMLQRWGIAGRLLCKRGEANLWMEVYDAVEDYAAFEAALGQAGAATHIDEVLIPGSVRKVECFGECA